MSNFFQNKVAVVAGGSQGAGFGIASALAQRGAEVILLARTRSKLIEAATRINDTLKKESAHYIPVDLSDESQTREAVQEIKSKYGIPDILILSSASGRFLSIEESDYEEALTTMKTTYLASFLLTRSFINEFLARNSGNIVVVGSPVRFLPLPAISYSSSRHALFGFSEALRQDLKNTNIKVTYAEPSKITEGSYFDNNPGFLERMPLFVRDERFRFLHQSSQEVGDMVVASIERGSSWSAHWGVKLTWFLVWCGLTQLLLWTFDRFSLSSSEGGLISREKRFQTARHM